MQLASAPWRPPLSQHSTWTRSPATPRIWSASRASPATSGRRWSWSPNARRPPGLETELHQYDLAALRALPGHPGEEADARRAVGRDRDAPRQHAAAPGPERSHRRRRPGHRAVAARPLVRGDRERPPARPRLGGHEGRRDRGAARARRAAPRGCRDARGRPAGRRVRGGRRARHLRRARARRRLRRRAAARADRPARRLRPGGRADLPRRRRRPLRPRGRAPRGLLGDRSLRARPHRAERARGGRQRGRRARR